MSGSLSATHPIYHQYRTPNHIYLFKSKNDQLRLHIYDPARRCLFKTSIPAVQFSLTEPSFNSRKVIATLVQQKLLPNDYQLPAPSLPAARECLHLAQQLIDQLKPKILYEGRGLEKFTCPLTLEVFKEPVIDEHGHTFEKEAIEQHLKNTDKCPINRQPIQSLTPNRVLQQAIEETQQQEPIPTFSLFKKPSQPLADKNLQLVHDYLEEGEYEAALQAFTTAFQYTKSWKDYQGLQLLYEKMKEPDKARLAYLYLVQYQLQDSAVSEALKTLQQCHQKYPDFLLIYPLLAQLYRVAGDPEARSFALMAAKAFTRDHPKEAAHLYQTILTEHPDQWEAYLPLASLLEDPSAKAHILLQGACHALQHNNYPQAQLFSQKAEGHYSDVFVDRLIEFDLLQAEKILSEDRLRALAEFYRENMLLTQQIKVYRMLIHLEQNPIYYEEIIWSYEALEEPQKALRWKLALLSLRIERQEWAEAEALAQKVLETAPQKISIYEQLETIYTHWHRHELCNLYGKLGQAYQQEGQLASAEKTYRKAFEQFQKFEHAIALAEILHQKGDTSSSVQIYYQASVSALLIDSMEELQQCVSSIRKVDPKLEHLDLNQRMYLLTQSRLLQLSEELQHLKRNDQPAPHLAAAPARPAAVAPVVLPPNVKPSIPKMAFGKAKWERYYGDVGIEPPLPPNIYEILEGPCPIWPGKKVQETHALVLIPKTVNGKPLTLRSLGELVKTPKGGGHATQYRYFWDEAMSLYGDQPMEGSYWILMTKDILPDSRSELLGEHQARLQKYPSYEMPRAIEASVALFSEYVVSQTRLYLDNPWTYTRCQERIDPLSLVVGGFSLGGPAVNFHSWSHSYGVGGCRKL